MRSPALVQRVDLLALPELLNVPSDVTTAPTLFQPAPAGFPNFRIAFRIATADRFIWNHNPDSEYNFVPRETRRTWTDGKSFHVEQKR